MLVLVTALSGVIGPVEAGAAGFSGAGTVGGRSGAGSAGGGPPSLYPLTPIPVPKAGPVPTGKGMWIHVLGRAEGGDAAAVVERAKAAGLTHLYVRLGSSADGFYGGPGLDRLLPAAHAAGLKVVGWDFPTLSDPAADAGRALREISYATGSGELLDAFSADIETPSEGTHLSAAGVQAYGGMVRAGVPLGYPLIATVPRPGGRWFPYSSLSDFDAIAPMVYWGQADPVAQVSKSMSALAFLGKPVTPVGQAYDSAVDGGPSASPDRAHIKAFIGAAAAHGAPAVSFWVWDEATTEHWAGIAEAPQFKPAG